MVTKEMMTLNDTSKGDFSDYDAACFMISKEDCKNIFAQIRKTPRDQSGDENEDYAEGEIQFMFDRDTKELNEVLVAPVYSEAGSLVNGDIENIEDYIADDVIEYAKTVLEEN